MKPTYHPGHGGAKMKLRDDIQPFWKADPHLPAADAHDTHVKRVMAAGVGGFPIIRRPS